MDSNRFFAEVARRIASQGITTGELNDGCLPLVFGSSGSPICRVTENREVQYWEKDMDTPEKVEARRYITSESHSAAEYVQAMENALPLKAVDSSDKYKLLLEHNGAKEEFATRSGLVAEDWLFNKEQLLDIYRAVSYNLNERTDLTFKQEDVLKEIKEQIEKAVPSAAAVLEAERQAELMQAPGFKMGGM